MLSLVFALTELVRVGWTGWRQILLYRTGLPAGHGNSVLIIFVLIEGFSSWKQDKMDGQEKEIPGRQRLFGLQLSTMHFQWKLSTASVEHEAQRWPSSMTRTALGMMPSLGS